MGDLSRTVLRDVTEEEEWSVIKEKDAKAGVLWARALKVNAAVTKSTAELGVKAK